MKPTTPQEIANCYGTFIADLVIMATVVPSVNIWLQTTLPEVNTIYKLNPSLFTAPANITSFPSKPKPGRNVTESSINSYNKALTLAFTAISIDLSAALKCAEVDSTKAQSILTSFQSLQKQKELKADIRNYFR